MSTVIYLYNEWDALAAIFALIVFFAMVLYGLVVVLTGSSG